MDITIKDKQYKIKYTLRALFIYEQIKKEPFALKTITDYYIFFYCLLLANNEDSGLTFDEFISALDEDQSIAEQMMQYLNKESEKNNIFGGDEKKKVMN